MFYKRRCEKNERIYSTFIRSALDVKLFDLYIRCNGFESILKQDNTYMKRYWDVVNRRNDLMHGNVDLAKDGIGTVYFDKKIPLYKCGADAIEIFQESILKQSGPGKIILDYIATHEFIYEIINHMTEEYRNSIYIIMADTQPGFDEKRGKLGRLFPDHIISFRFPGMRYDNELRPDEAL